MSFGGNIATMPFPDILQWLSMGNKTGTLRVTTGKTVLLVYLREGTIIAAKSNRIKDHLGKHLIRNKILTKEQVKQALEIAKRDKESAFETICVKLGFLSEPELLEMLRSNSESILYGMFSLNEGDFVFDEGELPDEKLVPITMSANDLMMKGIKLRNEWETIQEKIGGEEAVLSTFPELDPTLLGLTPLEEEVFGLIDGSRQVGDIVHKSPLSDYETFRLLGRFLDGGYVLIEEDTGQTELPDADFESILGGGGGAEPTGVDVLQPLDDGPLSEPAPGKEAPRKPTPEPPSSADHQGDVLEEANALIKKKQFNQAIQTLKSLLSLFPEHKEARQLVQKCQQMKVQDMLDTVGGDDSVPILDKPLTDPIYQSMEISNQEGFLLSRIDGFTTVKNLSNVTRIPLEDIFQTIYDLSKKGLIMVRKPGQGARTKSTSGSGSGRRIPRERTTIGKKKR